MINQIYKARLNNDGSRYIDPITNDFVNDLIAIEDDNIPEVFTPNWLNMKETLFKSQLFYKAISEANPNVYATLLKVIQDGENGVGKEQNFVDLFNLLNITWTPTELEYLDAVLQSNGFSIVLSESNTNMSARKAVEIIETSPLTISNNTKECDSIWCKFLIFVKSIFKKN